MLLKLQLLERVRFYAGRRAIVLLVEIPQYSMSCKPNEVLVLQCFVVSLFFG